VPADESDDDNFHSGTAELDVSRVTYIGMDYMWNENGTTWCYLLHRPRKQILEAELEQKTRSNDAAHPSKSAFLAFFY
jgi:hypothetical protein